MCGICGIANYLETEAVEERLLISMRDALTHRGPDDSGLFVDGRVGLGHRRLSIIDLSTGVQPIHNEDSSCWIVFNGEIYNYRALRKELEQAGHRFYTNTDTEIILHLYEQEGEKMLQKLNGMFAFCIWDRPQQTLFLARDRLGKKPLYYTLNSSAFLFGSELKALLRHPSVSREIDFFSLSKYLTYEYVPAPHTLIRGVQKLKPGHSLTYRVQTHELSTKKYWDIPIAEDAIAYMSEESYVEELLQLLREAVRDRLLSSDVPVGIFLSGGLDSSTIAALACEVSQQVKTFTIGFDEASFDESRYANQVADVLGTDHHVDVLDIRKAHTLLPDIMNYLDEPIGDASIIPTYLLSRFTAQHVKVALGGDGGDELFAGYPTFQALRMIHYYNIFPPEIRNIFHRAAAKLPVSHKNISFDFKIKQLLRGTGVSHEIMFFRWMGSFNEREKKALFHPDLQNAIAHENPYSDLLDYVRESNLYETFERVLYLMTKLYLQDDILVKVDRATMANSLEARAPLLDTRFVEFAAKLPTQYKLHRLTTKYLLKKAALKVLPKEIVYRKKKGFGIPVAKWICEDMKGMFLHYLSPERLKKDGLFQYPFIEQLLYEHWALKKDNRKLLWTLLIFQMWKERWIDSV
ncbi:asparagine synthase (Glutamine-hydrolyzing) [Candidatus Moduliflexus flocculans]|uniref:asparagine synthase (glutamine-hydrolyzing) n=1 Tax=Candidatus Moduliflexus flocculans TaxID=1499966 RepID=A0A081BNI4_9BACT|nr:asparagine synthase (Glutamine-hydrolyzing) [Candidatus Moduliflexus flocculans]